VYGRSVRIDYSTVYSSRRTASGRYTTALVLLARRPITVAPRPSTVLVVVDLSAVLVNRCRWSYLSGMINTGLLLQADSVQRLHSQSVLGRTACLCSVFVHCPGRRGPVCTYGQCTVWSLYGIGTAYSSRRPASVHYTVASVLLSRRTSTTAPCTATALVVVGLLYCTVSYGRCPVPYPTVRYRYGRLYSSRRDQGQRYVMASRPLGRGLSTITALQPSLVPGRRAAYAAVQL